MKIRLLAAFMYAFTIWFTTFGASLVQAETLVDQAVIINEIRLGGKEIELANQTKVTEYITLFNASNEVLSMDNMRIEYAKETFNKDYCESAVWSDFATSSIVGVTYLSGNIEPYSISKPIVRPLNNTGSGSIRLVDVSDPESSIVRDLVGWGPNAPCVESLTAKAPTTSSTTNNSLFRYLDCETNEPLDTNDNSKDFYVSQSNPEQLGLLYVSECTENFEENDEEVVDEPTVPVCEGLLITEILPNPNGADKGQEYIEIFNPTLNDVFLEDCILKTSASSKQYVFTVDSIIQPGEYKALYDSITGLTLANAAGGNVMLIGTNDDYTVDYPPNLKSNEAWAIIDGIWQATLTPTPGAQNSKPSVLSDVDVVQEDEELVACPAGKYRNPETNRCRNIQAVVSTLIPCKVGQIRSPETNRCRNVSSVVSGLVPCRPGQERNPDTNRCRNIEKTTSTQSKCQEGYERNTDTNRCRKKQIVNATGIEDKTNDDNAQINGIFLAAGSIGVIGYGAYEYRRDFNNLLSRIRKTFSLRVNK